MRSPPPAAPTRLSASTPAGVETRDVQPEEFGVPRATIEQLRGGDAETNARLLMSVLDGERSPYRDVVLANAAAAFTLAGKAGDFAEGARLAAEVLDSGAARAKLQALAEFTQRHRSSVSKRVTSDKFKHKKHPFRVVARHSALSTCHCLSTVAGNLPTVVCRRWSEWTQGEIARLRPSWSCAAIP